MKKAPIPDIISGIGAFVVYAFEQAAKQYSVVRLMFNHGQQCKETFYSLYRARHLLPFHLPDLSSGLLPSAFVV